MTLHIACKSLFSLFLASIDLVGYKIPLLEMVSWVYSSCLKIPIVWRLDKKADYRNTARVLGLERLLCFPSLVEGKKKKITNSYNKSSGADT